MIDLALTQQLDARFGEDGDVLFISGREAYNQAIALGTIEFFHEYIGTLQKQEALVSLEERAREVAREFPEYVSEVQSVTAEFENEQQTVATVTVRYISGEEFNFPVS